jgi:hypothetical protein
LTALTLQALGGLPGPAAISTVLQIIPVARLRRNPDSRVGGSETLGPHEIDTPGIYVHHVVVGRHEKRIERRTTRPNVCG